MTELPGARFAETEELPDGKKVELLQQLLFLHSEIVRSGSPEQVHEAQELISAAGGAGWPVGSYRSTFGALALIYARPPKPTVRQLPRWFKRKRQQ